MRAGLPKLYIKININAFSVKAPAAAAALGDNLFEVIEQLIIDALRKLIKITITAVSISLLYAEYNY